MSVEKHSQLPTEKAYRSSLQQAVGQSILQILRLVQLNLFERRDLKELFCREKQKIHLENNQLELFRWK